MRRGDSPAPADLAPPPSLFAIARIAPAPTGETGDTVSSVTARSLSSREGVRAHALRAFVAASSLASPSTALAGNEEGVLFGSEASLVAGAVTATSSEGSALWYNPAGIAGVSNNRLDVSGSAFMLRAHHVGAFLTAPGEGSVPATISEIVSIPAAGTYVRRLGARVHLAAGVFVPAHTDYTLRASYETRAGAQWVNTETVLTDDTHAGVGVGVEITPTLRIGASLFGVYRNASGSSQLLGGTLSAGASDSFSSVSSIHAYRSVSFEAGLGLQWSPHRALRLGVSLRSPGVQIYEGAEVTEVIASGTASGAARFTPNLYSGSDFAVGVVTPVKVRAGLAWTGERASLSVDADVAAALTPEHAEPRAFNWNVRVGGRYRLRDQLAIGGGLFTDRSPYRDASVTGERRLDFYGGAVGVEFGNSLTVVNAPAPTLTFATTIGLRYAYGSGEVDAMQVDAGNVVRAVPATVTVHEVGVNVGSTLRF